MAKPPRSGRLIRALVRGPGRHAPDALITMLARMRSADLAPVLVYHTVDPATGATPLQQDLVHNVAPDMFRRQMELLRRSYTVITVDEIADRIRAGEPLRGLAAVTFDDGYKAVLRHALPILEELEIPATFFISTKLVSEGTFWRDKVRYVANRGLAAEFLAHARTLGAPWAEASADAIYAATKDPAVAGSEAVESALDDFLGGARTDELRAAGRRIYCTETELRDVTSPFLWFGNHTHSHYMLSSVTPDVQRTEIARAQELLEAWGLRLSRTFAIPFGGFDTFGPETVELVREAGFDGYLMSASRSVADARSMRPAGAVDGLVGVTRYMPNDRNPWFLLAN